MDDIAGAGQAGGIGTTALGRLHLRVPQDDGFEDVVIERRCSDMAGARAWCERTIARSGGGTAVLEIQVFEESWHHARSWETAPSRPLAQALQLGILGDDGVHWSNRRAMTPSAGAWHRF